jgi:hypothetical protein
MERGLAPGSREKCNRRSPGFARDDKAFVGIEFDFVAQGLKPTSFWGLLRHDRSRALTHGNGLLRIVRLGSWFPTSQNRDMGHPGSWELEEAEKQVVGQVRDDKFQSTPPHRLSITRVHS